jgi:hypothetical protein
MIDYLKCMNIEVLVFVVINFFVILHSIVQLDFPNTYTYTIRAVTLTAGAEDIGKGCGS